ncbi:MAG: alpha/beta fold hydrolase [Cyanobacteria bacterium J06621_3]
MTTPDITTAAITTAAITTAARDFLSAFAPLFFAISNTVYWWLPAIAVFLTLKLSLNRRFRQRWGSPLKRLAIATLFTYLAAFALLWAMQPRLMYHPTHVLQTTPASHNLAYEDVWVPTTAEASASEKLHGWWIPHSKRAIGTLIYFHGAGLNIGFNVTQAFWLRQLGFNVLLIEYRGYGLSEGRFPTEASLYQDAETALAYLTQERQLPEDTIYAYGHSLGGAIAINLASHHPNLAGLIVHNSFTSMAEMVARSNYARWFPVQWMLTQRFDSLQKVSQLQVPMLLIHAKGDPLIPVEMGERLFEAARSPHKELVLVDTDVHHNAASVYKDAHHLVKLKLFAARA